MADNRSNPSLTSCEPRDYTVSGHFSLSDPPTEAEMDAIIPVMSVPGRASLSAHSAMYKIADFLGDQTLGNIAVEETCSLFQKEAIEANKRYAAGSEAATAAATSAANTAVPPTAPNSTQQASTTGTAGTQDRPMFGPERPRNMQK